MEPASTRPVEKKEALDQALSEAVLRVRNEPKAADECFAAMRDTIRSSPDAAVGRDLLKKLVATALSSWTPPSSDPAAFIAAASAAGFSVVEYGAGKHPGPAVVREATYPVSTSSPLLKSICRAFSVEVLTPLWKHLTALDPSDAFVKNLPELVRAGSREDPMTPKAPATSRFTIET